MNSPTPGASALEAVQAIVTIDADLPRPRQPEPIVTLLRGAARTSCGSRPRWCSPRFGPRPRQAVQSLLMALRSDVADVRQRAAFLLGAVGPAAHPRWRNDRHGWPNPDPRIRQAAAAAMRRIDVK